VAGISWRRAMGLSGRAEGQQNQTVMFEVSQHHRPALAACWRAYFEG